MIRRNDLTSTQFIRNLEHPPQLETTLACSVHNDITFLQLIVLFALRYISSWNNYYHHLNDEEIYYGIIITGTNYIVGVIIIGN